MSSTCCFLTLLLMLVYTVSCSLAPLIQAVSISTVDAIFEARWTAPRAACFPPGARRRISTSGTAEFHFASIYLVMDVYFPSRQQIHILNTSELPLEHFILLSVKEVPRSNTMQNLTSCVQIYAWTNSRYNQRVGELEKRPHLK
ncbi:hypothetical protein BD779DRAFT_1477032 [Infundibulicybe gibba]|nr:hypothetical protein BD779DRAFT_1477032 [Infundibulicybe gibba]